MIIGGLQKNSLIDYPPHISCVIFTQGCNFRCPYCHNPDLVAEVPPEYLPLEEEDIFEFLAKRKTYLDGVVISGGEPTLHPDLFYWCRRIREMGYLVKVDTNGSRPEIISRLIDDGLVDFIAMDIKTDPERYAPHIVTKINTDRIRLAVDLILDSGVPHEFRTTCVNPIVDEAAITEIAKLITGAKRYALQRPNLKTTLNPAFFENMIPHDESTLRFFQSIAAPHVDSCILR